MAVQIHGFHEMRRHLVKQQRLQGWGTLRRALLVIPALTLGLDAPNSMGATFRVPADYSSIQEAINASVDGDEILIDPGTYVEYSIDFRGLSIRVSGIDPENPEQVAATVIDGDYQGTVFDFHSAEDSTAVLTGVTITGGSGHLLPDRVGGGITCRNQSQPTISHCLIRANRGNGLGAGVFVTSGGRPKINDCTIVGNDGSGIHCHRSSPEITACLISRNSAESGGGLYCREASPDLRLCVVQANQAEFSGGGIYMEAGSVPSLVDCQIVGNVSGSRGGGMYCQFNSTPTLDHCEFRSNHGEEVGGGVYCIFNSGPAFLRCRFAGNTTNGDGGAIASLSSNSMSCLACTFTDNTATGSGGAIQIETLGGTGFPVRISNCIVTQNFAGETGAGLYLAAATVVFNSTIIDNSAGQSGGGIICLFDHEFTVRNTILWSNSPDQIDLDEATVDVSYSDVQAGWSGRGNLHLAPTLVLLGPFEHVPNPIGRWRGDTYIPLSPCVDQGDPAVEDALSETDPRWPAGIPNSPRSDIGAYGGSGNAAWYEERPDKG